MNRLKLHMIAKTGRSFVPYLRRQVLGAHRMLRTRVREASIVLVDERAMADLHRRFLKRRGSTDVMTFPLELDSRGRALSGDIVICVPVARRRAGEHGARVRDELLLYALHGLLHLSGWDDRRQPEFERMHRTEDRILSRLGVGALFYRATPRKRFAHTPASRR